ncbi:MAG: energy-coupling factor transporter transmembrane protein EcfT, partial [Candidatus Latescibacteria bacterium]|nr:energy-coupling factor transporter transmembrane protein EcfT [Candidatus Latescibacterota bacterium]
MHEGSVSKRSFLQTLSPLTKFLVLVALTVVVFFARSPWVLGGMLLYTVGLFVLGGIRMGKMRWLFVPLLLSAPVTFGVFVVSYWVESGSLQAGLWRGLSDGGLFLMRIFVLLTANILFVRTSDMRRFAECLGALRVPHILVVLIATVFRFLPLIMEEVRRIVEVQRSRGLRPVHLLWPCRFLPIVIPLLLINMQ